MSEAARVLDHLVPPMAAELPIETGPVDVPTEDNDNEALPLHWTGERIGFEIPPAIWIGMVGCYAVMLTALLAATGGGHAAFAIAISAVYVAMFFGTARGMLRLAPAQPRSPLSRAGGKLATLYGPLGTAEVAVQMLLVPALIAGVAIAVAIISAWIM